ncbi:MAG: hepatitis A virus cellular receptor 1 [Prevotella sp.]|jgi:hypothetical protein
MKRLTTLLTMVMPILLALSFSSCDDDPYIADSLAGTWEGKMYVSSMYDGYTYDATYSELGFNQDPYSYSSGTGYWVDHYAGDAPYEYIANHTEWTVRNGMISVFLVEEGTTVRITDYHLSDGYFVGTIYYGDDRVDFRLRHTSSPNWGGYEYGFGFYYNAKKNTGVTRGTSDNNVVEVPYRIIRKK